MLGPEAADDAWSETFLSAMRAYPELSADGNVEAWLVTIAHRKSLDQVRAASRRPVLVPDVPDRPSDDPDPSPTDSALWIALKSLPLKQRQAVAYHHVAGLSYREIAALIGGSPEAARRAASDGIATLRSTYRKGDES